MIDHMHWRKQYQVDSIVDSQSQYFLNSPLRQELHWIGVAKDGIPILLFRPNHQGYHQEDAVYIRFIIWTMQQGVAYYQLGHSKPLYLLVDRTINSNGSISMIGIMRRLGLIRNLVSLLQDNYPEVLKAAYIIPTNTI